MTQRISTLNEPKLGTAGAPTPIWRSIAIVFGGSLLLALAARISVPMLPVPMTMQTYAVLLLGALLGWRMAGLSVLFYLGEAVLGFPVLANGAFGVTRLIGPTGGYLLAFPFVAMAVGWAVQRSWGGKWIWAFATMLAGHVLILTLGTAWLATALGWEKAIAAGATPFLVGSVVKSALVVSTVEAVGRIRQRSLT